MLCYHSAGRVVCNMTRTLYQMFDGMNLFLLCEDSICQKPNEFRPCDAYFHF